MLGMKWKVGLVCALAGASLVTGVLACSPGGVASTLPPHHDTSADASVTDGGPSAESGGDGGIDASSADGGPDCAAIVAALLTAPILPNKPAGLDPTRTVDVDGILACATYVEPTTLPAGVLPRQPGYRVATFGAADDAGVSPLTLGFNIESRLPGTLTLEPGDLGLTTWPDGRGNTFTLEVGYPLQRNGAVWPLPWTSQAASDPNNLYKTVTQIYNAAMLTWGSLAGLPASPPSTDCHAAGLCGVLPDDGTGHGIVTFRALGLKLTFDPATTVLLELQLPWAPNAPSCMTHAAALERMDDWPIGFTPVEGPPLGVVSLGGLTLSWLGEPGSTVSQADAREGCGGTSVTAPDPGYAAMQWGASGEVLFEYDADSGAGHAVFGRAGYRGQLACGGFVLAVGSPIMLHGAANPIDWTSVATATPTVSAIIGAWVGTPETDCVAANDCTIAPDDGQGHSTFTLTDQSQQDPTFPKLVFVFPKGSSVLQEVIATE